MTDLQNKRNKQAAKQSTMPFKTAFTVFFAAVFWLLPDTAKAVSSRTFDSMYAAAARGDVPALREAMHRGLRIDAVNRSGDTGVCAAVKRQDYRAYNAFVQAGARTNPPCLSRINRAEYEEFINSDEIVVYARNQYTPPAGTRRRATIIPLPAMFPTGRWASSSGNWTIRHKPATRTTCFICRFLFCFPFFPENHIDKHIFPSNQRIPEHQ